MGTEASEGKSVANKIATKSSAVLRRFKDKGFVLQFSPGSYELMASLLTAHGEELIQSLQSFFAATAPYSLGHSSSYSKSSAASSVASTCLAWEVGVVECLRACVVDPGSYGLPIRGRIIALGCLAAVLGDFQERMEVAKVPRKCLPPSCPSPGAQMVAELWDPAIIKAFLEVVKQCSDAEGHALEREVLHGIAGILLGRMCSDASFIAPGPREHLDKILQDRACMHAIWAALSSGTLATLQTTVPLLYHSVKRAADSALLAAASGTPHPGSLSALLAMGGEKPLTRAMQCVHAAAAEAQQQKLNTGGEAPVAVNLLDLLLRVVEKAVEYDSALRAQRKFSSFSAERVLQMLGEGMPGQALLENDATIPPWPEELLQAHMALVFKGMQFRSLAGRPRFFTPGHAKDLTHYPQASRLAVARYLCRNLKAISVFEKYMAWVTDGFASAAKTWSKDQMDAFDWAAAGLQFINHAAVEAKGREADELKRLLPRGFLASCAVKMLDALATPFVPISNKGSVTKGTWHGVEMTWAPMDGGTGMRPQPSFVMSRAAEAAQIVFNLLPCGPHSEAAAVIKSAGPRVQKMVLKVCEGTGGLVPPAAFGLDADSLAGSNAPAQSSSKGAERVCLACGKVGNNMKRCGGCGEVFMCDAACQQVAWPSHRSACRKASAAKNSST